MTQELIPVKPSADWGLTRGGAHSQWPRGLVSASLVANDSATSLATGVRPAATRNAADVRRGCAIDGGWVREGHREEALTRAHLIGPTGDAGVAGVRRSGARGGGRSSAMCGVGLRRARRETDGPDGIRGPPEARWCHGFEQRGSGQESYAAMADGGARECGRGCYGTGTSKMKEGKRSGAHRGCDGGLGELGEAPEPTNLTKMAGGPEVEEDIEGGVAARPGPRGSLRR